MQARETSTDWSLKRRSDDVDEEFGEFEEDKELDEDFDDELDEDDFRSRLQLHPGREAHARRSRCRAPVET